MLDMLWCEGGWGAWLPVPARAGTAMRSAAGSVCGRAACEPRCGHGRSLARHGARSGLYWGLSKALNTVYAFIASEMGAGAR